MNYGCFDGPIVLNIQVVGSRSNSLSSQTVEFYLPIPIEIRTEFVATSPIEKFMKIDFSHMDPVFLVSRRVGLALPNPFQRQGKPYPTSESRARNRVQVLGHFALFVITMALAGPNASEQDAGRSARAPNVVAEFDFEFKSRRLIVVPVRLGDRVYPFAVDTAASHMLFDTSLRSELGPVLRKGSVLVPSGTRVVENFSAPQAFLGSLSLKTREYVFCSDLSAIKKATGSEIRGLIGMTFLKDHILDIDFDRRKLRFLADASGLEGARNRVIQFDKNGIPSIELELPLGYRRFHVDTAFNQGLTLKGDDFTNLLASNEIKAATPTAASDLNGMGKIANRGLLRRISASDLEIRNIPVYETSQPTTQVGLQFLARYRCTLDFPANVLYLREPDRSTRIPRK